MTKKEQTPVSEPVGDDEKARAAQRKWYKTHKEPYNQRRRNAYAADPKLREEAAKRQKDYRANNPRSPEKEGHFRNVGKKKVQVFRITEAAAMVNRSAQGIRLWESDGKIPKPSIEGLHRYYTMHQITLMGELAELMDQVRYDVATRKVAVDTKVADIKLRWKDV